MATWGMQTPPSILKGKPDTGVTNIRNVASPHWRRWLGPENRFLVPWTRFSEWEDTKPKATPTVCRFYIKSIRNDMRT